MNRADLIETVARQVRAARMAAGMSQERLAEAANVTDETVGRIERGVCEASLGTLVAFAAALGVSVDSLVTPGAAVVPRAATKPASKATVERVAGRVAELLAELPEAERAALLRVMLREVETRILTGGRALLPVAA